MSVRHKAEELISAQPSIPSILLFVDGQQKYHNNYKYLSDIILELWQNLLLWRIGPKLWPSYESTPQNMALKYKNLD